MDALIFDRLSLSLDCGENNGESSMLYDIKMNSTRTPRRHSYGQLVGIDHGTEF